MPSPVGHALGGMAAGWHLAPKTTWRSAAVLAAVAIAPDLDLLAGEHRGMSHSIGAAVLAGAVAWIVTASAASPWRRDRLRWALAVFAAWASHVALDWMSNDTRPPIGVMALWPFTQAYYKAGFEIFPAVSRRYWLAEFWIYNLKAVCIEVVVLAPIAAIAIWTRRRLASRPIAARHPPSSSDPPPST